MQVKSDVIWKFSIDEWGPKRYLGNLRVLIQSLTYLICETSNGGGTGESMEPKVDS